jgi:hypothetical protein
MIQLMVGGRLSAAQLAPKADRTVRRDRQAVVETRAPKRTAPSYTGGDKMVLSVSGIHLPLSEVGERVEDFHVRVLPGTTSERSQILTLSRRNLISLDRTLVYCVHNGRMDAHSSGSTVCIPRLHAIKSLEASIWLYRPAKFTTDTRKIGSDRCSYRNSPHDWAFQSITCPDLERSTRFYENVGL